jgi:hypothetical protein
VWWQGCVAFRRVTTARLPRSSDIVVAVREYGDRVPDVHRTLRRAQEAAERAYRARLEAERALELSQELRARLAELEAEMRRPLRRQ